MGRAIDVLDSMEDKGQRTTHVDLVEDVKSEETTEEEVVKEKPKSKKSNETAKQSKKD